MQLARATDFSLRVLMVLANADSQRVTCAALAAQLRNPSEQMMKIVQRLAKTGYVATTRGKLGGVRLNVSAEEIRLGEVVQRIEPTLALVDCANPACTLVDGCRLKVVLDGARDAFLARLDESTLADVARLPQAMRVLLRPPAGRPMLRDRRR